MQNFSNIVFKNRLENPSQNLFPIILIQNNIKILWNFILNSEIYTKQLFMSWGRWKDWKWDNMSKSLQIYNKTSHSGQWEKAIPFWGVWGCTWYLYFNQSTNGNIAPHNKDKIAQRSGNVGVKGIHGIMDSLLSFSFWSFP